MENCDAEMQEISENKQRLNHRLNQIKDKKCHLEDELDQLKREMDLRDSSIFDRVVRKHEVV